MRTALISRPCDAAIDPALAFDAPPPEPGLRPALAFSTATVEPARQFDAWQAHCGPLLEISGPADPCAGYRAYCTAWKLGPFAVASMAAEAAAFRRTRIQARRDAIDHWVIRLARRGTSRLWMAADAAVMPAGQPFVFSLANAFEGERSDLEWVSLIVPRDLFPGLAPVLDRRLLLPLDGSLGLLLGRYLDALDTQLGEVLEAEVPRLVAATRAMVAACVVPSARDRDAAAPLLEHARLERVRQAIRHNLRSPTLTPDRLCRLVGMSRSQLYRLFEPTGGVARHIQAERLREAHRALADPDNQRDICAVAEDLGFYDASSFSRTFRREYGCTPSEVRATALAGTGDVALMRADARLPAGSLTEVLRLLR